MAGDVRKKNQQQLIFPSVLSPVACATRSRSRFFSSARSGTRPLCLRKLRKLRALLAELSARVAVFVSSAEVGRAFDTGGVFSARGETLAVRASLNFKRRLVGFEVFARRRLFTLSEEDDNTGIFAARKALEKHLRESDGSTGYENGRCEYLQHQKATPDGLWTAFRTVWETRDGLRKAGWRGFNGR